MHISQGSLLRNYSRSKGDGTAAWQQPEGSHQVKKKSRLVDANQ